MFNMKEKIKKVAKRVTKGVKKAMTTGELKAFQQKGFKKPQGFKGGNK